MGIFSCGSEVVGMKPLPAQDGEFDKKLPFAFCQIEFRQDLPVAMKDSICIAGYRFPFFAFIAMIDGSAGVRAKDFVKSSDELAATDGAEIGCTR
jgi:hypothetical protein